MAVLAGRPTDVSLYATATGFRSLAATWTIASPARGARTLSRMGSGAVWQAAVTLAVAVPTDSLAVT